MLRVADDGFVDVGHLTSPHLVRIGPRWPCANLAAWRTKRLRQQVKKCGANLPRPAGPPSRRLPRRGRQGKKSSSANSDSATSIGVPNTVVKLEKRQDVASDLDPKRDRNFVLEARPRDRRGRRISAHFAEQIDQRAFGRQLDLAPQAVQEMRAPFGEIDDSRRQPARMQREAHGIDRPSQQFGSDIFVQFRQRRIAGGNRPMPVQGESRVGFCRSSTRSIAARAAPLRDRQRPLGKMAQSPARPGARCARAPVRRAARRDEAACRGSVGPARFPRNLNAASKSRHRRQDQWLKRRR